MDHHYLPQFYLRGWLGSDGKVVRYWHTPKGHLDERPVAPRGTAFEPALYETPPHVEWEPYDPNIIETDVMSPIDGRAAPILRKLVDGNVNISSDERAAWGLFLNSLVHRHRDGILERDEQAPTAARQVLDGLLKRYEGDDDGRARVLDALRDVDLDQMAKTSHRTIMVHAIRNSDAVAAVAGLSWAVVTRDVPFITTDRPLIINLNKGGEPALMTIALSPTKLFIAHSRDCLDDEGNVNTEARELFRNLAFGHDLLLLSAQPCRYVYSSRQLDDTCVLGSKVIRLRTAVDEALARWSA